LTQRIISECSNNTYQIALGGCGDPDQHENFEEILMACTEVDIVPNLTTSGFGMTKELASICKKYCGSVAVSWYRSAYTIDAIRQLLEAGVKTNIHFVLMRDTLDEALELLKNNKLPSKINAVIFLLHKPIGAGTKEQIVTVNNKKIWDLIDYIESVTFPFKIGFDSCTVPALIRNNIINKNCLDTCEAARWSAYISAEMKMMPCSFDNQDKKWSVDLRKNTIRQAWHSKEFNEFRKHFHEACPDCDGRESCMGGCQICPEIVLCDKQRR